MRQINYAQMITIINNIANSQHPLVKESVKWEMLENTMEIIRLEFGIDYSNDLYQTLQDKIAKANDLPLGVQPYLSFEKLYEDYLKCSNSTK